MEWAAVSNQRVRRRMVSEMAEWKIVNRGRYYICRDGEKFCEVETLEDAELILASVKRDNGVK